MTCSCSARIGRGLGLGLLTNPGATAAVSLGAAAPPDPESVGSWTAFLTQIIPENPVLALSEGNVLQIVFLAVVAGGAALAIGRPAEPFLAFNRSLLEIVQKALW